MRNAERAGTLEKGSANKLAKNFKKGEKRKENEAAPAGIPVDMASDGAHRRGKPSTHLALRATQVSTASLGKFDEMRQGEPECRTRRSASDKKHKLDDGRSLATEAQKSREVLQKVMNGSKEKERDAKKGKYAKGETAYGYDYNNGLGDGSFKKVIFMAWSCCQTSIVTIHFHAQFFILTRDCYSPA